VYIDNITRRGSRTGIEKLHTEAEQQKLRLFNLGIGRRPRGEIRFNSDKSNT
jgi:hypothetical protein